MKTLSIVFALFLSSIGFAQAQTDQDQIESIIQDSFDELFSALSAEKILNFYTEDFILLEQGEVWDNKKITEYFETASARPRETTRTNRFEFIKTEVDGNRGWTSYWNWAKIESDNGNITHLKWLESATAVKTPNGWRLDMLHSTRVESDINE